MKELLTSLLNAKRKIKSPVKNRKAMYGRYADLEAVLQAVEDALSNEGLIIEQGGVQLEGHPYLRTTLWHAETGQKLVSDIPIVAKDPYDPQKIGGSITYARRYGISAMLTLVADDDDDGNTAAGKNRDGSAPKPAQPSGNTGVSASKAAQVLSLDIENPLPKKLVDALIVEMQRAEYSDSQVLPVIRKVLNREVKHIAELTEAEAKVVVGHARKVRSGETGRLS